MEASSGLIQYTLILDNAPFPDLPDSDLQLSARPDPTGFTLVVTPVSLEVDSEIVRITVRKGKREEREGGRGEEMREGRGKEGGEGEGERGGGRREGRGKEGGEGEGGRSGKKSQSYIA